MSEIKYGPTDCRFCQERGYPPEGMTGICEYCGGIFCFGHMNPESHNCTYRIKPKQGVKTMSTKLEMVIKSNEIDKTTLRKWADEARELLIAKAVRSKKSIEISLGVI